MKAKTERVFMKFLLIILSLIILLSSFSCSKWVLISGKEAQDCRITKIMYDELNRLCCFDTFRLGFVGASLPKEQWQALMEEINRLIEENGLCIDKAKDDYEGK